MADILSALSTIVGEETGDVVLEFVGDLTDTLEDYETRLNDETDWRSRYEENDAEWRKKYKERFFNHGGDESDEPDDREQPKKLRFEDLFTKE